MVYLTALSISQIASNDSTFLSNELERIGSDRASCKALSRNLPGGTEENHERHHSEHPVSGPRFEPGESRKRSRSANRLATTFGTLKKEHVLRTVFENEVLSRIFSMIKTRRMGGTCSRYGGKEKCL
jgi:hypothetical protein